MRTQEQQILSLMVMEKINAIRLFLIDSENIPVSDGTLFNIVAVYGPDQDGNGCKYESDVFNGSVTITTESTHDLQLLYCINPS